MSYHRCTIYDFIEDDEVLVEPEAGIGEYVEEEDGKDLDRD